MGLAESSQMAHIPKTESNAESEEQTDDTCKFGDYCISYLGVR